MGGKWIIRLRKGLASRCWENLILAMLGEQFMVGEEICGAVVSVRFQVKPKADTLGCTWSLTAWPNAQTCLLLMLLLTRRTSSPSGTKQPVTRGPPPASETPCAESSTCPPTPSWSTRHTQTALSMYVFSFFYFLLQLFFLFISFHKPACSHTFSNQRGNERVHLHVAFLMACF